ncbi:MAG: hypothetical protein AAF915_08030 [Cyanobacteria bacterium P01_D01_bin.50]
MNYDFLEAIYHVSTRLNEGRSLEYLWGFKPQSNSFTFERWGIKPICLS